MTATFLDYLPPTATELPRVVSLHLESPVAAHAARREGPRRGQHDERARRDRQRGRRRARRRRVELPATPQRIWELRCEAVAAPATSARASLEAALAAAGRARRRRQGHRRRAEPRAAAQLPPRRAGRARRPQPRGRARRDRRVAGGELRVGALCPQRALERHRGRSHAAACWPLALPYVGHVATRNRGTVGGSIAHADAAAELPLCLLALGGSAVVEGPGGRRTIAAADLFVTAPDVCRSSPTRCWSRCGCRSTGRDRARASRRSRPRHGDYGLRRRLRAAWSRTAWCAAASLAAGAVSDRPVRLPAAERAARRRRRSTTRASRPRPRRRVRRSSRATACTPRPRTAAT